MDSRPKDQAIKYLGPPVDKRGVVRKRRLEPGAATSLEQLKDYTFFTPAVPYLFGLFREVYWSEWMRSLGHDVDLYFHKFEQQIFDGLISRTQDPTWNYALLACRAEDWPQLTDFFCELTVTMRQSKTAIRYAVQELNILDPLAMDKRKVFVGDQTRATIHAFGLYGSHGGAYFEQATPMHRPKLTFQGPNPEMVTFAEAYFKDRNPINATEPLPGT